MNSSGQPEIIIQILDNGLVGLKSWTTYLGLFGEMSEADYWDEFLNEMIGGDKAIIDNLFEKEDLTIDEINQARDAIENLTDTALKKEYYIELQKKVPYYSQRDNETSPDLTCNVTSLAGVLTVLGLQRPCTGCSEDCNSEETIADYLYCVGESILAPFERTLVAHWNGIAEEFGIVDVTRVIVNDNTNRLQTTVKSQLENGCGVLLSVFSSYGHIVRLLDATEDGLIVDDPYGELEDGADREINGGNYDINTYNSNENSGSENLWLWTDIEGNHNSRPDSETFRIKYVVIYCN